MDFQSNDTQSDEDRSRAPHKDAVADCTVADVPTSKDSLGFVPYTDAIARFLLSKNTKPPLTLSVEGEWGSGKTSFMRQLEQSLKKRASEDGAPEPLFFRFDAWRSDGPEAVWASFAVELLRFLAERCSSVKNLWSGFRLEFARFDRVAASRQIALAILIWLVFGAAFVAALLGGVTKYDLAIRVPWMLAAIGTVFFAGRTALEKTQHLIGNPLRAIFDLRKYASAPDYSSKRAFRSLFAEDLPRIINSYVPGNRRLFIFIDDLDRADPDDAAQLMCALSMLLSTEDSRVFFIIGVDRRKVAAGIALRNDSAFPYLFPDVEGDILRQAGLDYGYSFMEKFIQLPFSLPQPTTQDIERLMCSLSGVPMQSIEQVSDPKLARLEVELGTDSKTVRDIVLMVAEVLDNNPRRIKQFINVFRLRAYIAGETGLLTEELTLQQLGIVVALTLRWPRLLDVLKSDPRFLEACKPK